jgi:hypothetical protein
MSKLLNAASNHSEDNQLQLAITQLAHKLNWHQHVDEHQR